MKNRNIETRKRIQMIILVFAIILVFIFGKLIYIQAINSDFYRNNALDQWTRGIDIEPVRGTIFDSKGRKLAVSLKRNTVWARPGDLEEEGEDRKVKVEAIAQILSDTIDVQKDDVIKKLNSKEPNVVVKQWIEQSEAEVLAAKLKENDIKIIQIVEDNRRYYPKDSFASYIIGHTNFEQVGQYGIESVMNKELSGVPGKLVTVAGEAGRQLKEDDTRKYSAKDGNNLYLTIDSGIQEIVEEALKNGEEETGAKRTAAIVMDPKTGEILAMGSTPGYDLNESREISDPKLKEKWDRLSEKKKQEEWYKIWRNYNISDFYEPGSTFKPLVVAAALEENLIDDKYKFTCDGFLTDIKSDTPIKCWRWYDPHGEQTLKEGLAHSCNDMMGDIGLKLGGELLYNYIKKLGYGESTGISLQGESTGIIPADADEIKEATLANISFGQGLSSTPIQHITALSTIVNGGELVQPKIVKEIKSPDGKVSKKTDTIVKRRVFSKEVSKKVLDMLQYTAEDQYQSFVSVPGYSVGAKTGTSQKIVNGKYSNEKYVGSFVGIAPIEDPKFILLVIVDEPSKGKFYGSEVAGPIGNKIMNETLRYMKVEPTKDINDNDNLIAVPSVIGQSLKEATDTLKEVGLDYSTSVYYMTPDDTVSGQNPVAGEMVPFGSYIDLELSQEFDPKTVRVPTEEEVIAKKRLEDEERRARIDAQSSSDDESDESSKDEEKEEEKALRMPDLKGKTLEDAIKEIELLGVRYTVKGSGKVTEQKPAANSKVEKNTNIEIVLK